MHCQAKLACTEKTNSKDKLRWNPPNVPKTDSHSWGTGSGSNSQWHQRSSHEDTSTDQAVTVFMETHNKVVNKLAPVGDQTTMQPPVIPIAPVTPITPKPFLEPETPAVQEQSPQYSLVSCSTMERELIRMVKFILFAA